MLERRSGIAFVLPRLVERVAATEEILPSLVRRVFPTAIGKKRWGKYQEQPSRRKPPVSAINLLPG